MSQKGLLCLSMRDAVCHEPAANQGPQHRFRLSDTLGYLSRQLASTPGIAYSSGFRILAVVTLKKYSKPCSSVAGKRGQLC
jgi:hypothetical protein